MFIFPLTLKFNDLARTAQSPPWTLEWRGELTIENKVFTLFNLFLIALGIAIAWRRWGWVGFTPLVIESVYFLSNAFARASGGRYIIPVDWGVYFYYALGLYFSSVWLLNIFGIQIEKETPEIIAAPKLDFKNQWVMAVATLLLMGLSLPLSGHIAPVRFAVRDKAQVFNELTQAYSFAELGIESQDIEKFLSYPESVVFQGRALYPRFFRAGTGLCSVCDLFDFTFAKGTLRAFHF